MEQIIYKNILLASFVAMYAYGLFSFLTLSPEGKEYDNYRVSRKFFGVNMIRWATYLVVHWHFNLRLNNPLLASTICFSCYYPGIMLFEATFSSLINRNYPVRKRIKKIVLNAIVINAIVFTNYFFCEPTMQKIVLWGMAVALAIEMVILCRRFLILYRNALNRGDNYYSENIEVFIRWMPNCIYIAVAFGFAGSIFLFSSNSAVSVYMFGGLLLFTYIFISYQNYMINITKIKDMILADVDSTSEVATKDVSAEEIISEESLELKRLEMRMNDWLNEKGFIKKGITIEELAVEFGTNRTYLSSFINSTYKFSFREWVAMHRIEYAKKLLLADQDMPSTKIAEKIGYSPNAFTTIFTKTEGMSPTQWRSANKQ